jgi:hypothetical protein
MAMLGAEISLSLSPSLDVILTAGGAWALWGGGSGADGARPTTKATRRTTTNTGKAQPAPSPLLSFFQSTTQTQGDVPMATKAEKIHALL